MERVLNIFHYSIYLILNKFHLFNNKLNPVFLLLKLPYFKKKYKKNNFDLVKFQNEFWMNKKVGVNIWLAEVVLGSVVMIFFQSFFFIITRTFNINNNLLPFVIIFVAVGTYITYQYVSKNNKYLEYYIEFEHWPKSKKRKYTYLSLLISIGTVALFFASFIVSF